jgi:hypothetical protein
MREEKTHPGKPRKIVTFYIVLPLLVRSRRRRRVTVLKVEEHQ